MATNIAERGGLNRPHAYIQGTGIGTQLIQKLVLTAATDDMQVADWASAECCQFLSHLPVQHGEAIKDTAGQLGGRVRHGELMFTAGVLDLTAHIGWINKTAVIGIDQRAASGLSCRLLNKLR